MLLGVVLLELGRATTGGVGTEQLVALPPALDPVTQNCSAWPMSSTAAVYVKAVAPGIAKQSVPYPEQRIH